MFLIHPVFQCAGIGFAVYVMKLGLDRFRMAHLKHEVGFEWKRHVHFGLVTVIIWLTGIFGGLYTVKTSWHGFFITGVHAWVGLSMLPFVLFAIGSGIYMDRKKMKRKTLPVIHAIANTVMLGLAMTQIYTGIQVYRTYVLGL